MARPCRRAGWLALALAAAALLALPASSGAYVQRVESSFFGINGQGVMPLARPTDGDPAALETHLTAIQRTGVSWVRSGLHWAPIESTAPWLGQHTYNWTVPDAWVTALARHGLRWHPVLQNAPTWAQDPALLPLCTGSARRMLPPSRPADFGTFAAAVAKRYGPGGAFWKAHPELPARPIQRYEIFNEENDKPYWCPAPDAAAYAHLYVAARDAIHGVDAQARVMIGGLAPNRFVIAPPAPGSVDLRVEDFLRGMVNAEPGLASKLDAVGVHTYRRDPADVLADLAWYRRVLESAGLGSAPLEVTETGWPTRGSTVDVNVREALRARSYRELTDQMARTDCGIIGLAPYTWITAEASTASPEDWYGIANQDGSLKPSGQAYADEVKLFEGAGSQPAPRTTQRVCGLSLPDADADGTPDSSDDYPLDPTRQTGSGEHNPADDPASQDRFQPARLPDEFFGVTESGQVRALLAENEHVHFAAMRNAGIGSVRWPVDWASIEPLSPASAYHDYQWGATDQLVRRAAIHGLRWRPTFRNPPDWALAAGGDTQVRSQFASFLGAFARRYGSGGSFWDENRGLPQLPVTDYEIWYRANISYQWTDGSASASEYADFYLAARAALESTDPSARATLSLSTSGVQPDDTFLVAMTTARPALIGNIDGVHISTGRTDEPGIEAELAALRTALDATANADAPITLETGFAQDGPGAMTDAQRQTAYETLLDRMARSDCGVGGVFPRAWTSAEASTNQAEDWVGIARASDGSLYLAGQGYRTEARLFEGRADGRAPYGTAHACGLPAPDRDGDGIPDEADDFPLDADLVSGSDADGDGVFNQLDPDYVPGDDTTPPAVYIDSGPDGPIADPRPSFAFSSEPGASFQCRFDSDARFTSCGGTYAPTGPLADGDHVFWVRASDGSGNVSAPVSRGFAVDTTGPAARLDSGPASAPTNDATPSFTFSSPEADATFTCSIDGGAAAPCASPFESSPLTDGWHTLSLRAVDSLGNAGPVVKRDFLIDLTAPVVRIDSGPTGLITTALATFQFSAVGKPVGFECRLDGEAYHACTSPWTLTGLLDGWHGVAVRAYDAAGNVSTPATRSFTVDTVPSDPDTLIESGPSGLTTDASPRFAFSATVAGSSFECSLDGSAFTACASPLQLGTLSEGSHSFAVRAKSLDGGIDSTPAARSFTVDTTAPAVTIASGPTLEAPTASTTPSFDLAVDDPEARLECRVDGAEFASCSSPFTTAPLAEGRHLLAVRATDAAGNVGDIQSRSFVVDLTAPFVVIDSAPSGTVADATPSFAFSGVGKAARFECSIDGAALKTCASPYEPPSLVDGPHRFAVRALDAAGNASKVAIVRFGVDTTAPLTTLKSPVRHKITDRTPTFSFSATDGVAAKSPVGVAKFRCRIDRRKWRKCSSPLTSKRLRPGRHRFRVYAVDALGNRESPVRFRFRIVR